MDAAIQSRRLSVGDLFRIGWSLYRNNFRNILLVALCVYIPASLIVALISEFTDDTIFFVRILEFLDFLLETVGTLGIAVIVEKSLQGTTISWGPALRHGLSRLGAVVITELIAGIIVGLLSLLLIIPGIIWGMYYSFSIYVVALKNLSGKQALNYSKSLVKGQWWRVAEIFSLIGVLYLVVASVITFSLRIFLVNPFFIILRYTLFAIVSTLFTVITVVFFLNMDYFRTPERKPESMNANTATPVVYIKETEDYSVIISKIIPNLVMLIVGVGGSILTYFTTKADPLVLSACSIGIVLLLFFAIIGGIRLIGLARKYSDAKRLKDEGEIIQASIQKLMDDQIHLTSENAFTFMVLGTKYVVVKDFEKKIFQKLLDQSLSIRARYVPGNPPIARIYIFDPLNQNQNNQNQNFQHPAKSPGVGAVLVDNALSEAPVSNVPNKFDRQVSGYEIQTVFGEAARHYEDVVLEITGGTALFLIGLGYIVYCFAGGQVIFFLLLSSILFGIGIGIYLMLRDANNFREARLLHDRGTVVSGIIKDFQTTTEYIGDSNSERKVYTTRYEFLISGTRYIVTQKISGSLYQELRRGSTINVRYLPENPLISRMYL